MNKKHLEVQEGTRVLPSLTTVLLQEMERFNALLDLMRLTLDTLSKSILGLVVISKELDDMYTALLNNQIPSNWQAKAYPSLKPL